VVLVRIIRVAAYDSFYQTGKLEELFEPDYTPSDDDILR